MNPHDQRPLRADEVLALKCAAWRECQRLDRAEQWAQRYLDGRYAHDARALAAYYLRRVQVKAMDRYWSGK
jgi:hypothetical protein